MKKISIYFVAFTMSAATIFTSCEKDPIDPGTGNNNTSKKCYVTTVKDGAKLISEVTYNSNDLVNEMKSYDDSTGALESVMKATYDANNRLIKMEEVPASGPSEFYVTFEYNADGKVSKTTYFFYNESTQQFEQAYMMHEYDGSKRLVNSKNYYVYMGQALEYGSESYIYDSKGNVTKSTTSSKDPVSGQTTVASTTDYTYDDKKNPLNVMLGASTFFGVAMGLSPNNILTEVTKDKDGNVTNTTTNTYTYTAENYPLKVVIVDGSETTTNDYSYNCK